MLDIFVKLVKVVLWLDLNTEFSYFTVEPVLREEKPYRLILLLCFSDDYLGVINAYRVNL